MTDKTLILIDSYLLAIITNDYASQLELFQQLKKTGLSFNEIVFEIRTISQIIHTDDSKPFQPIQLEANN